MKGGDVLPTYKPFKYLEMLTEGSNSLRGEGGDPLNPNIYGRK